LSVVGCRLKRSLGGLEAALGGADCARYGVYLVQIFADEGLRLAGGNQGADVNSSDSADGQNRGHRDGIA
jgi:hypothetical protein